MVAETQALDFSNDVTALTHEARSGLGRMHVAHVRDDWSGFLSATEHTNGRLVAIEKVARDWSGAVEAAPRVTEGQLELLCPDALAGPGHGRAA